MSLSRPVAAAALAALLFLLAGCATAGDPPAGSAESAAPEPSAPPLAAPTPTPSVETDIPAPTAQPETDPNEMLAGQPPFRVRTTCLALLSKAELSAAMGVEEGQITIFAWEASNGYMASRQSGTLQCRWTAPSETMGEITMMVEVLADAAVEYAAVDRSNRPAPPPGSVGKLGKHSRHDCYAGESGGYSCSGEFEMDGYWASFDYSSDATLGAESNPAPAVKFGTALRTKLLNAGPPRDPWVVPAGSQPAWSSCAVIDNGKKFRKAVGSPGFGAPEATRNPLGYVMFTHSHWRGGLRNCVWRHANISESPDGQVRQLGVEMVPGAAWAWPAVVASQKSRGATQVSIAGADDAWIQCDDTTECHGQALVGGSWLGVDVSYDQYSDGDGPATTKVAMAYVIARL